MQLFRSLCIGFKLPNGHIFRGKNRLVKPVSKKATSTLKKDFEREEQNLFFLRHPYLTKEESRGHVAEQCKHVKWLKKWEMAAKDKFTKHRTLHDELSFLKVNENWDFTAGSK